MGLDPRTVDEPHEVTYVVCDAPDCSSEFRGDQPAPAGWLALSNHWQPQQEVWYFCSWGCAAVYAEASADPGLV